MRRLLDAAVRLFGTVLLVLLVWLVCEPLGLSFPLFAVLLPALGVGVGAELGQWRRGRGAAREERPADQAPPA
ncbi:hypothetical protein ABZW47_08605 [Streptomyces sp. NPDC004549]|uniref:hypothetical protein n=1 Tax=Streptomyces sp. NPDC004549 TaxID=3154283 RepID=UPI0033B6DFAD